MKYIKLTRGRFAIVDDDDYEELSKYNWHYHKNGYALRHARVEGKRTCIRMHRVVLDAPQGFDVDHINMNKLDNRKENLRVATRSQNNYNKGVQSNSTSGFTGVSWNKQKNKWRARIYVDKKPIHLGFFEYRIDAAFAYNEAALKYHGEFAKINNFDEVICE